MFEYAVNKSRFVSKIKKLLCSKLKQMYKYFKKKARTI